MADAPRVLVVDDDPENRAVISELLEFNDIGFALAESGEAAVAACREQAFDLVLMDIMMPGMDGLQATAAIRALGPAQAQWPIVAVTARRDLRAQARWTAAGLNGCLTKPFSEQRLLALVAEYT